MLFLDPQSRFFRSFISRIRGFCLPIHLEVKSTAVHPLALRDRLRDGFLRRRCASGARRLSTPSARSRRGWVQLTILMKMLPRVASEMALHVLAYNLTRVMNIIGIQPLLAAIRASGI